MQQLESVACVCKEAEAVLALLPTLACLFLKQCLSEYV